MLDLDDSWSVARLSGFFDGQAPFDAVPFIREDGRPDAFRGLKDDGADAGFGAPVPQGARIVTQVQRWDRLKGGLELVEAFASQIDALPADAHLVLVGPRPDPSREAAAARVLGEIVSRAGTLPHAAARRIHVLAVPTTDREVNQAVCSMESSNKIRITMRRSCAQAEAR